MSKPVLGLVLGGILGVLDGLSALISAPETAPIIMSIVAGSTFKGLAVGLIVGYIAKKKQSLAVGLLAGLAFGAFTAWLVTLSEPYFWEIILPGSVLGVIVGYATQRYGRAPVSA